MSIKKLIYTNSRCPKLPQGSKEKDDGGRDSNHFIQTQAIHSSIQSLHLFIHSRFVRASPSLVIHSYTFIPPSLYSFIHSYTFINSSIRPSIHSFHSSITYLAQDCVAGDDHHNGEHSQAQEHNKVGTENHRQELQSCTPE